MKLSILYAATLFLSSSTLEVKAAHGYWGKNASCCNASYINFTPTGMSQACYWGAGAIGEACTADTGNGGCAHGFCDGGTCALCTADTDCSDVCAVGLGCVTGEEQDSCTDHSNCDDGFCAYFLSSVAVTTKRCHDGRLGRDCDANDQCSSGYCDTSTNGCHNGIIDDSCGADSDCESGYCDNGTSLCATPTPPAPPVTDPCLSVNCGNGGTCISMGPTDVSCRCENTFQEFLNSNGNPYCDCVEGTLFNADANRCFAPPTMAPTKEPTVSPTASPTASPTSSPTETENSCVDDESGTFVLDNDEVEGCDWLTKNSAREEIRKNNYCYRHEVKTLCPLTCDFCECKDDPTYTFTLVKAGKTVDCSWLTKNKSKMDQRTAKYCTEDFNGGIVLDGCTKSCGKCLADDA